MLNPPPNSVTYFARLEVLELAEDRKWLAKMPTRLTSIGKGRMLLRKIVRQEIQSA